MIGGSPMAPREKRGQAVDHSSGSKGDTTNGHSLGANSYVSKPVDFVQFADAVRQLGLYWLLLNEPPPTVR